MSILTYTLSHTCRGGGWWLLHSVLSICMSFVSDLTGSLPALQPVIHQWQLAEQHLRLAQPFALCQFISYLMVITRASCLLFMVFPHIYHHVFVPSVPFHLNLFTCSAFLGNTTTHRSQLSALLLTITSWSLEIYDRNPSSMHSAILPDTHLATFPKPLPPLPPSSTSKYALNYWIIELLYSLSVNLS